MDNYFTCLLKSILQKKFACLWFLLLGGTLFAPAIKAQTISGVVYRDFNSDGIRTAPANATGVSAGDVGVAGIVVTAYSSNTATSPIAVTTSSTGTYTITTGTGQFRLEFTNLPQGDFNSFRGTGNGTNVQFLTVTTSQTDVNFAINYPQNYCDSQNPEVVTTCFVSGTPTSATPISNTALAGGRDVIVGAPYSTTGDARATHASLANALSVGSVWGLAYRKTTRQLFSSAFQKRHVGYGPGGAGAIYVTTLAADQQSGTTAATPFFNFSTVAGASTNLHGPLSVSAGEASFDIQSFSLVGKVGLGDIDISDDEQFLYVVNLFNRRLYQLNITTKDTVSFAIPSNCSTGSGYRPFAVKYNRGKVYVGVVCTREDATVADANNDGIADTYGATTGLQASVYEYTISGNTATTAVAISFPLTYEKAPTNADYNIVTDPQARAEYWRPWTNVFRADRLTGSGSRTASYPQPWLTDIEFDVNGDMILGVRDRFGDQMGYQNYFPISSTSTITTLSSISVLVNTISPGEILRAGKCSSANSWTIEANGSTCTIAASSTAQTASQGPGDGKFYWGDRVQLGANHGLSSLGGLALLGGSGQVMMTAMDPNDIFNTGGLKRLVNATGAKDGENFSTDPSPAGFYLYTSSDITSYGKANGIGDVELMCAAPPIQIGNRVWFDQNQNGIQDPGEPPIAGAVVRLYNSAKTTVLASVTTNANGEYYFSSTLTAGSSASSAAVSSLSYNTGYALAISSLGTSTVVSSNLLSLTSVSPSTGENTSINSGTTISNNDATIDPTLNLPCIRFQTGALGGAIHNFDFGLIAPCYLSVTVTAGACSSVTNQYTLNGTVSFTNTTASSVTVAVGTQTTVLSVSAATASLPFTLTGLASGLGIQTVTVTSSASVCGTTSRTFASPVSCTVPASVTATSATVCAGSPASLTALGCIGTIQWAGPTITSGAATSLITVSTSASITTQTVVSYTATCVLYSSTAVSVGTVTVVPIPSLTITASPSLTVTQGSTVVLTAAGCSGGTLSGAGSTSSVSVTASLATNVYSFSCTRSPGCTGTASITIVTVPPASVTASNTTVCAGQVASLTATGCSSGSLAWSGANITSGMTGSVITVSTSNTTSSPITVSYTVTCTTSTSSVATAIGTVTVVPIPSLTLTASPSLTVTQGSTVVLTAAGCSGGTLSGAGSTSSVSVTASLATNVYSFSCTRSPGCTGTASITIVTVPPASVTASNTTVCAGQVASLTATGCSSGSLAWSGANITSGTTGSVITVSTSNTTSSPITVSYTVTCTTSTSSVATAIGTVTVVPIPSLTITASPSLTVTQGSTVVLTAAGCSGGTLSGAGSTSSVSVTASLATNVYSFSCTRSPGCTGTASITIVTVPPASVTASNTTVCAGQVASLTATGCSSGSLAWSGANITSGTTGSVITVSTSNTTSSPITVSYTVTCTTSTSSVATAIGTVTVVPIPSLTLTASSLTVVQGSTITLTTLGCSLGTITGAVSTSSAQVMVMGTTNVYSVTCTNQPNCSGTASVTVIAIPTENLMVSSATVCSGQPATLTAIGCNSGTVSWNGNGVVNFIGTTLNVNTPSDITSTAILSYTATCTNAVTAVSQVGTVTVVPIPSLTITASPSLTVTQGSTVVLTAAGCSGGTLSGAGSTSSVSVTASLATNVYSFSCTRSPGCTGTASITIVTVPPASVTASNTTVCAGQVASLTATGCSSGSLTWSGANITSGTTGSVITVSTSNTTSSPITVSYTVTCTTSTSSVATAIGTVTVVPIPSLTLTASSLTVVQGSTITLTTLGCSLGTITGAVSTSSAQVMVMGTTNVYSVTCTNQPNCSASASVTVTGVPATSLIVNSVTVCAGQTASLTAIGCSETVTFSNVGSGTATGNVLTVVTSGTVSAITQLSYVATCTTNLGSTTALGTITVVPTPSVSITATRSTVGNSVTLTALGCAGGAIVWSTAETTPSIQIAAGPLTLYSVTCTVGPNCRATAQLRIAQVPPVLDVFTSGGVICAGQSVTLTAIGCGNVVAWSTGEATASIVVNPTVTTAYSVSCSDDVNTVVGSATVTVQPTPTLVLTASSPSITPGQAVTITATGCQGGTVVWSTGSTANGMMSIVDSPTVTTTYTATCTTGPQCQTTASISIGVLPAQTPVLSLIKLVSTSRAQVGDVISYTVLLTNTGTGEATNVLVRDSVSAGLQILAASVVPSTGSYSPGSPISVWAVQSLPANATATLTFSASVTADGVVYNKVTIPGDTASVCTTIPIRVCRGTDYAFEITAPTGYVRYQWFRRATPTSAETIVQDSAVSSFTATQPGEYRVVVNDAQGFCPDLSCCPLVIEEDSIPAFTVMARTPTCVANQPQSDGTLTLMGLGADPTQYTYQYSVGNTFNAAAALPAVAATVPANGVILSNLNSTQTYTVRVFNRLGCFRDVTVNLVVNCACPAEVCVPITIRKTRIVNP